jgi:hypothetical protein
MDKTPQEPRLDEDLPVEDENAEQVTGGHFKLRKPAVRKEFRKA